MLKKVLRKIKHKLKNIFSIKIPVKNPILYGELLKGDVPLSREERVELVLL